MPVRPDPSPSRIYLVLLQRFAVIFLLLLFLAAATWFATSSRAAYETAPYTLVEQDGPLEIRDYPALVLVSTSMDGQGQNQSFGRLFRYISGENQSQEKIAMTTPVFMPGDAEGATNRMQFVLPEGVAQAGAPIPSLKDVVLERYPAGRYAALRFKGRASQAERRKQLAQLRALLTAKGLTPASPPIFAGYDPPWTPGPLRRNEVLLRVN